MEQSHQCERLPLNEMGFADYMWHTWDGKAKQRERKQAGELLGKVKLVEEQLKRQIDLGVADQLGLIVEGMIGPSPTGCIAYAMSMDDKVMYKTGNFRYPYTAIMKWFANLEDVGIPVRFTPSWKGTAMLIGALHDNDQKPTHSLFTRTIMVPPRIKEYDPYVLTVMGVHNAGFGEEMAKSALGWYQTPIALFNAPERDIADTMMDSGKRRIGPAAAGRLVKALGRNT